MPHAPIAVMVFDMLRKSITSWSAIHVFSNAIHLVKIWTVRSGAEYGKGVISTALTTLKMAEVAPMPSARVTREATAKPGLLIRPRTAWVMSWRMLSNMECLTAAAAAGLASCNGD